MDMEFPEKKNRIQFKVWSCKCIIGFWNYCCDTLASYYLFQWEKDEKCRNEWIWFINLSGLRCQKLASKHKILSQNRFFSTLTSGNSKALKNSFVLNGRCCWYIASERKVLTKSLRSYFDFYWLDIPGFCIPRNFMRS